MKYNKLNRKPVFAFLVYISLIVSCTKVDNEPDYSYLVSKEYNVTYTSSYINSMIDIVADIIPEVTLLKSYVVSDVDIYRIVYKTTVSGETINASGLICIPKNPGEYPVLSFQNGTNTVNAYCPSEYPINYSYQLIESLASMGYVVLLADYPGFGASAQIPHPYLVKDATVQSLVDMLYGAKELDEFEMPDVSFKNEYYLLGYSQGGWATLALHKALELDYSEDFNLAGSVCGAGPYDLSLLMKGMLTAVNYPMPVYLGYILHAYTSYNQFTNPLTDIFNEPYADRVNSLYNGLLSSNEINEQLNTNIAELITADFLSGFESSLNYSTVRDALENNSITAWQTFKPLLLIHGENDVDVDPISTESMYESMINEGSSSEICRKVIVPGVDHGEGIVPSMVQGIFFLKGLTDK